VDEWLPAVNGCSVTRQVVRVTIERKEAGPGHLKRQPFFIANSAAGVRVRQFWRLVMRTRNATHKQGRTYPAEQAIRYWMRTPVITVSLDAPLSDALAQMREHDVRRLPVVLDTGELCGMITQGDIRGADVLRIAGLDPLAIADALRQVKVYEVMAERPLSVTPETSLREAAMLMIENKIGGLPVIDASGDVVGIVTESDLFEVLVQELDREAAAGARHTDPR
jgi:acetoin utilization protein AcuB/CBS domain-containing protein